MTPKTQETREIITPGEIIGKAKDLLPGDWTQKQGENIIAIRLGILDTSGGRLVKIIPISGVYVPRRGNIVIAKVIDITTKGWICDVKAPSESFLLLKECPMYVNESEMESVYDIEDLIVAKISKTGRNSIDLTTKGRGLGKIKDGIILEINPNRVPRLIGKEGSMIKLIKISSGCEITVGQNGLIWIKGESIEGELFAKRAIEFVKENTITEGLTEKVEEWLSKNKIKTQEIKEKEE